MKLGRMNHVGVATPSIEMSVAFYRDVMGAEVIREPFDLPAQGVKVCFVDTPNTQIELIEPLGEASPIHGFLAKNPAGGQHHICYEVPDIHAARDRLVAAFDQDITQADYALGYRFDVVLRGRGATPMEG